MTNTKKQVKITKLFRKGAAARPPDDCDDIQQEIQFHEQQLKEKQNELFKIQRNSYKRKATPPKHKMEKFVRPQNIILNNSIESLKRNLDLMSMLTGVEVQSYVAEDHCCIVYHLQNDSLNQVKHGLRIEMKTGENVISKSSLPLGFNFKAVVEGYQNVMMPECLCAIRKALVAYYDRLDQFEKLKKILNIEAQMFKLLDGSHMEISFCAQNETEDNGENEKVDMTLILDYRVYDIRPKVYSFKGEDLPEGALEILKQQCAIFKKKPLYKAFQEAFMSDLGAYKLVDQLGIREEQSRRPQKRFRPNKQNYHNDDTFLPEECSDQGDDDEVMND